MKKKLLILFFMSFMFSIFLIGCGKEVKNTEDGIDYLKNLDSYSSDISIKIENDKQVVSYNGKQAYSKKYGQRLDLEKNRILIYKDNKIYVKDIHNGLKYDTDKDFDSVFKQSFISEYINLIYTNEKIKTFYKNIDNSEFQVIELDIPGNNKSIDKAELYINAKDFTPKYLYIYNNKNVKKVTVEYSSFVANGELAKELFNIE